MKKKNSIFLLTSALMLLFLPITANATESNSNIETYAITSRQLIYDHNAPISKNSPYISKTFIPSGNSIAVNFCSWNNEQKLPYTYYLEMKNSNGSWTVVASMSTRGCISTSETVIPNNVYRMRATTTQSKSSGVMMDVSELVYD